MKLRYLLPIFIFCFLYFSEKIYSQDTLRKQTYDYCELIGTPYVLSRYIEVQIDTGRDLPSIDRVIKDEKTGKVRKFRSMIEALKYMQEQNWEFVQAYIEDMDAAKKFHYVLRKVKE